MEIEAARTGRKRSVRIRRRPERNWLRAAGTVFSGWLAGRSHLLSHAFEAASGAQLIVAPDRRVLHANAAFRNLFDAVLPRPCRLEQVAADPSSAATLCRLHAEAAAGDFPAVALSLPQPDGGLRHCRFSASPIPGYSGYSLWRAEEIGAAAVDAPDPLMALLDMAALGWFSSDGEGRFLTLNKTLAGWLGAPRTEFARAGSLCEFLAGHDRSQMPPWTTAASGSAEVPLATRQGDRFDARIAYRSQRVAAGRRIDAIVRNLSGEREAACHLPREWFRRFFAQAPIGIGLIDRSGRFVEANRAIGALFDRDPQDLIGRDLTLLVGAADRARIAAALSADAQTLDEPIEVRLDGPQERTLVLFLGRLAAAGETEAAAALHCIDVTERKNLEQQFAQSQKMQAVGQLAGGIAHDFNNLLTAMIGFCDLLLLRCRPGDPSFADIMQIQQNARRAANLVRQLLAFSRQQALQPRILDITDILVELSHLLRRLIGENIDLELVHGRNLGLIKVDQGQFEQVIINLVVNARDAMPGGGRLTVGTSSLTYGQPHRRRHETLPAGDYVVVEVADTGIGIPAAHLERIFEPFFSTKEIGSGTGLGLSTVYGIVRQTGGFVFVESVPGRGSKFQIYLPCCQAPEPTALRPEAREPPLLKDLTGSGRIMLVEDDDPVRIFGARALRNKGYTVLEARSGESAIEQIRNGADDIDLLITDVVMPNMDGPRLVREMRELAPSIKVIFISGYAEDAFRRRLGSDGDIDFLAKPFTLKELAAKVKEVLKARPRAPELSHTGARRPATPRPGSS